MTRRERRLLIISPHFPPDPSAGAHRARVLAPYLQAHGWRATVLTAEPQGYEGCLDHELARSLEGRVRVVRVPVWDPAVTRRAGVGDLGLRSAVPLYRAACTMPADAIYLTTYPVYPATFGPRLRRTLGAPLVVDLQDPWVGEWGRSVGGGPDGQVDWKSRASRAAAGRIERFVMPRVDALTSVSSSLLDELAARYPSLARRPRLTLPIGIDPHDVSWAAAHPRKGEAAFPVNGDVHLCYAGTMLPLGYQTLDAVLQAAARVTRDGTGSSRLCLHFVGTSNQASPEAAPRVRPRALAAGLGDAVHEIPRRIPFLDALRVLQQASIVLIMGTNEARYTASKVQAALASGRPIVALVHAASDVARVLAPLAERDRAICLFTYDEARPPATLVEPLATVLRAWCEQRPARCERTRYAPGTTGPELAGSLAGLLDGLTGEAHG